jgi:glycosyltransferase involved in cell wall biosynthesis
VAAVVSFYDSLVRESEARLAGLPAERGRLARLPLAAELLWTRAAVGPLERRACAGADLLLVNYDSVRRILDERYGVGARVRRIAYAAEAAFVSAERTPLPPDAIAEARRGGAPVLVCVARHDPRKGVPVLLHALARLRARGIAHRAVLVGDGLQLAAHRRLAAALELGATTRITGWVEDAFAHVAHADVFALPSLEEGSGSMALLEALQAGAAVVASRVDGIPEDVVDGESALLVPPGDPDALASALARALGDAALRARLGAAARAAFEARFTADRFAAALGERYAELLQRA